MHAIEDQLRASLIDGSDDLQLPVGAAQRAWRRGRRRRSQKVAAAAGVGVVAFGVAAAGIEAVHSHQTSAGAGRDTTIEELATTASKTADESFGPNNFLHIRDTITQGSQVLVYESWTSYAGDVWRRDTGDGAPQFHLFPPAPNVIGAGTPQFLAHLPTNTTELDTYMRTHVTGSNSTDEAVFTAVGDTMREGYAPPALRAAMIRVLDQTPHVTSTLTADRRNQPAIKITFTDPTGESGPQSLLFDPTTSALIEEQDGPHFTADYSQPTIVAAIPHSVIAHTGGPTPPPTGVQESTTPTSTPTSHASANK